MVVSAVCRCDAEIHCSYRVGRNRGYDVKAGTLQMAKLQGVSPTIIQPFAATGGADAESIEDAQARALASLDEPSRAVTLSDFENSRSRLREFNRAGPGTAEYHPEAPCFKAPGCVTVVYPAMPGSAAGDQS
jgi:hypothetical protein